MKDKETPIYVTRTFRCPNCESRNLKWEKWGSDPDVKKKKFGKMFNIHAVQTAIK